MLRIERATGACQLATKGTKRDFALCDPGACSDLLVRMFCDFCAFLWRVLTLVGGDPLGEGVAMDTQDGGRV